MSRNFNNIPTKPYIGTFFLIGAMIEGRKARVVPLSINWLSYGASSAAPNQGIAANIQGVNQAPLLSSICSVYIDNTNSTVPIYILFPDTNNVITCQAGSAGWFLAMTNLMNFFIFGLGFTTGQIPQTNILLTDVFVVPNTNAELPQSVTLGKASAIIQRGQTIFNSTYAAFALGDQQTQNFVHIENNGETSIIFPVLASGFYIITGLTISLIAQQQFPPAGGVAGTPTVIMEGAISGHFRTQLGFLPQNLDRGASSVTNSNFWNGLLFLSGSVQWKIPATEQWQIRVDASNIGTVTGQMIWDFTFTQNPN